MRTSEPLRVALFTDTYTPQMNGVAKTLNRLVGELGARGHAVRIYTTSFPKVADSPTVRRFRSVPFWAYEELRLATPHTRRVVRELANWRPSIVHAATPFGLGLTARWAARSLGVPFVTSYHTSLAQYARFYGLGAISTPGMAFLRWFHNGGRRTFVPTTAIGNELEAIGFRNLAVWSRGVDPERFHPRHRAATMRERMGARPDDIVVAYVGRVAREKGIDVAARAMALVEDRHPNTLFAIAGDGPAEAECRRIAPRRSFFAGRLSGESLSAFYASADIFVFPSTTDTFGNVLLEAMASAMAIVTADVPQSIEVVGEDVGTFARAGDHRAFAGAIAALLENHPRLDASRRAAREAALTRRWDDVFDRLVDDYRSAIAGEPPDNASATISTAASVLSI